jgi:hypothetical protein
MKALEGFNSLLQLTGLMARLCKLSLPRDTWVIPNAMS